MSTYDAVPYTSLPYPRTHPDHLHAMARLFGVRAAPVEDCRVLEIGCGAGANLLARAAGLPRSRCVGIDASEGEIARARDVAAGAGIENVTLRAIDAAGARGLGAFDYVIVHGVLSWVAPDVRRAILRLVSASLAEHGVAYASYNVHPGWHLRGAVRGMLRYHAAPLDDPRARIAAARATLDWLSARVGRDGGAFRAVLDEELERLAAADDTYLFHELLEDENHPLWFHELVDEARACGLAWLAEADPAATVRVRASPRAHAALRAVAGDDPIRIEQHFDFLRGRSFRASLLVREGHARVEAAGDALVELVAASRGAGDLAIDDPIVEGALATLATAWPDGVPIAELAPAHAAELADRLAPLHAAGHVELRARRLGLARGDVARPLATSLARNQARGAGPVTNLRHEPIPLGEHERAVLALADGTRDRAAIVAQVPDAERALEVLARFALLREAD